MYNSFRFWSGITGHYKLPAAINSMAIEQFPGAPCTGRGDREMEMREEIRLEPTTGRGGLEILSQLISFVEISNLDFFKGPGRKM